MSPPHIFAPLTIFKKIWGSLERLASHSGGRGGSRLAPFLALHPPSWLSAAAVSQSKVMVTECYYPAGGLKLDPSGGLGAALMISTHKDAKFTSSCLHNRGSRHLGDVSRLM